MIEKSSRPMTAAERAACDPSPELAVRRRTLSRSTFRWAAWGAPTFITGVVIYYTIVNGTDNGYMLVLSIWLVTLGAVLLLTSAGKAAMLLTAKDNPDRRAAFDRGTVEVWTIHADRAWWNLADEDCDGRLLRTTDGRYVFIGTYDWLDVAAGDDDSRPQSPTRFQVVDDCVHFTLTALDDPSIPLVSVPDPLPPEVYDLPHFKVVVYDKLPPWLEAIIK